MTSVIVLFAIFAFVILTVIVELRAHKFNHTIFFIFDTSQGLKLLLAISFVMALSVVMFFMGTTAKEYGWFLMLLSIFLVSWIYVFMVGKRNVEILGKLYGILATFCLFVIMCVIGAIVLIVLMIIVGVQSDKHRK